MKKWWVWLLVAALIAGGCDDDDDDDNDAVAADDDSANDDDDDAGDDDVDDDVGDDDSADDDTTEPPQCWNDLAVGEKIAFLQGLPGSEGIAFDSAGELYASIGTQIARVYSDGTWEPLADFTDPIGIAFDDDDNLYIADFGEGNLPAPNDGAVYRRDAAGAVTLLVEGIANPNYITLTPQGTLLVSDNYTTSIYELTTAGELSVWYDQVDSPNGMVFSAMRDSLYVAGTFAAGNPVYRIDLDGQGAPMDITTIANLDLLSLPDGIALDANGMLYVTEDGIGKLVRVDPATGEYEAIASGMVTPASMAFGVAPDFDPCSLYVTELIGRHIWRISVGVAGAPLVNQE